MARLLNEDAILRGLPAISRDALDGRISPHALRHMVERGHIELPKIAGRYTSTRRRVREMWDRLMDDGVLRGSRS
jgi:hypothetical protein